MKSISCKVAFALILVVCAGCGDTSAPDKSGTVTGTSADPIVHFKAGDSKMNTAISKARATADRFIKALNAPQPNQTGFSIKKEFPTKHGTGEHIWLSDVTYANGVFSSLVDNDPEDVANLKAGDK